MAKKLGMWLDEYASEYGYQNGILLTKCCFHSF